MKTPLVTWFGNDHDHSLHYFKFGLMRLAASGEIRFQEIQNSGASADLLPEFVRAHKHRRTAAVRISDGSLSRLVILDGEDSIFQTSPLIEHCDLYLSCTYRSRFFNDERFDLQEPWQSDSDVAWYREEYKRLQERFRTHFHKACPLAPIGPAMEWTPRLPFVKRKVHGLRHRLSALRAPKTDWGPQYERFSLRWEQLMEMRKIPVRHDVVLKDSLWGWPMHRVTLHRRLASLSGRYDIRADLNYLPATEHGGINAPHPDPADFPMKCGGGVTGNYEEILAASRIGVFSTGFHWGCRNIVTLAWLLGLKVLSDPFVHESWFDFKELETEFTTHSGDWSEIDALLGRFSRSDAVEAKPRIQASYDRLMGPLVCARKIIEKSLA